MKKQPVLPSEISDYKSKWSPGVLVKISSDLDLKAKDWCRKHLDRHEWSVDILSGAKEHTFRFEHNHHAKLFKTNFGI